jgi:hypothetical protein
MKTYDEVAPYLNDDIARFCQAQSDEELVGLDQSK